jgi:hypothetical protein
MPGTLGYETYESNPLPNSQHPRNSMSSSSHAVVGPVFVVQSSSLMLLRIVLIDSVIHPCLLAVFNVVHTYRREKKKVDP